MKKTADLTDLRRQFDLYYQEKLESAVLELEQRRHFYLWKLAGLVLLTFLLLPLMMLGIFIAVDFAAPPQSGWHDGAIWFNYALVLVAVILLRSPFNKFRKEAKSRLMPKFLNFFGEFRYQYQNTLSETLMVKSMIFPHFDRHEGDDFFCGCYNGVGITLSEEILKVRNNDKNRSLSTVFKGIAILLDMNKNFAGQTVVKKDRGLFNKLIWLQGLKRIQLEDPVFEKEFEVFGDHQVEARYLLTTAFMERMLKLREVYRGRNIEFSFFDNRLLIAIDTRQDMFETSSLLRRLNRKVLFDKVFEQFYEVFSVVEILKLTQRTGL